MKSPKKLSTEFIGYISENDDPDYILKNILKWAKNWISTKKYPGCQLTKKVHVKIELGEYEKP